MNSAVQTDWLKPRPVRAVAMGAIFLCGLWLSPRHLLPFTAAFGLLLIALAWIDLDTFRLPDPLTVGTAALGGLMMAMRLQDAWVQHLLAGAGALAGSVLLEVVYRKFRGRDGLGRGDAKLFGALGLWVGPLGLAPLLLVASASGLVAALLLQAVGRYTGRLAFGPWLALGGWTVWCAGNRLL